MRSRHKPNKSYQVRKQHFKMEGAYHFLRKGDWMGFTIPVHKDFRTFWVFYGRMMSVSYSSACAQGPSPMVTFLRKRGIWLIIYHDSIPWFSGGPGLDKMLPPSRKGRDNLIREAVELSSPISKMPGKDDRPVESSALSRLQTAWYIGGKEHANWPGPHWLDAESLICLL